LIIKHTIFNRWFPILVHLACLTPLGWLIWDAWAGNLTADPIRASILRTGKTALVLLLLTLACTPLSKYLGFTPAIRVRRTLGDYSFLYVCIHFAIFVAVDYGFYLAYIGEELTNRPYALVGLVTGILLIPLAVTSFPPWPKRLGKNWKRLHRLVYVIILLDGMHFILSVKQGVIEPYLWMLVILFLLALRIPPLQRFLSSRVSRTS
jgi:sulfoxide reductase heme-binding subunit YedZ